jgi:hypothetical protein
MLKRWQCLFGFIVFSLWFFAFTPRTGDAKPPDEALRVGAASVELESDDSMVLGGAIAPRRVIGQEGKIRACATVLELGGQRVALVACDILMIRRDYLDAAARRIEKELGIPFDNVLINATHNHHAPSTVTIHGYERNEVFCGRVRDGVVAAVRQANERLKKAGPVELLFRLGEESSMGQNSRLQLDDGTIYWTGLRDGFVRPTGPFDPELPVLAFQRKSGGMEALLFNHSTHLLCTVVKGVRSPSYYGLVAENLEGDLGGTTTFFSGAFGSTHDLHLSCQERIYRIENAVRKALTQAKPRPVKVLRSLKRELPYRVRQFDEEREQAAVSSYCRKYLTGSSEYTDYTIEVFRKMRRQLAEHQGEQRKTWVQALRIGDIAFVGVPGEFFTVLGMEIKRRSPFRYTYVAGVANDYIGYIPDARAFELGGYQVWTGFHSLVAKGTGEAIVDATVEMLEELYAESEEGTR